MKAKFYLILLLVFFSANSFYAQNLKPDLAATVNVSIPPTNTEYIGLTRLFIVSNFEEDQRYPSFLAQKINRSVYTLETSQQDAEMYFTYEVYRNWKKYTVASYTQSTSTDKKGNSVTTTTYRYDGEEEIQFVLRLYLANGTILSQSSNRTRATYYGTSTSSYQAALNDYNNYRDKKTIETIEGLISSQYDKIANEYLFTERSVFMYSIGVKSRKHDFSDMNVAAEYMKNWLASSPTDLNAPDVIEANKLYDAVLLEYEPTNKARVDNEIAAVVYYEKACMEFMVKNYRKAEELILKSEELDKRIHHSQEGMKNTLALMKERKVFN